MTFNRQKPTTAEIELRTSPTPVSKLSKNTLILAGFGVALFLLCCMMLTFNAPSARGQTKSEEVAISSSVVNGTIQELPATYDQVVMTKDELSLEDIEALVSQKSPIAEQPKKQLPPRQISHHPASQQNAPILEARRSALFFSTSPRQSGDISEEEKILAGLLSGDRTGATGQLNGHRLSEGTLIPASLLSGINSDLPGPVLAQVTQNVFDSVSGQYLLIPQGSKLIGKYDSQVSFDQKRTHITWTRLILPNGAYLSLNDLIASDMSGYSGLRDAVDNHTGDLIKAGALSTVLGVGSELARDTSDDDVADAIRDSIQGTANEAGQQVIQRQLGRKPTLTIRPGWRFQIIVTSEMTLAPYSE